MAATVTTDEVIAYLQSLGYTCDSSTIECIIAIIDEKDPCFDANGYPDCTVKLIKIYLAGLLCIAGGAQRLQSERDLSGDARSFDTVGQTQGQVAATIRQLDYAGCVSDLIPATKGAYLRTIGNKLA